MILNGYTVQECITICINIPVRTKNVDRDAGGKYNFLQIQKLLLSGSILNCELNSCLQVDVFLILN